MKPASLLVVAVTTALITLCTSFSSGKGASPSKSPAKETRSPERWITNRQNTHYYWFIANGDVYDGYYTLGQEIGRMETLTGKYCDNDPSGELVSRGYSLPIVPHLTWPFAYVFSH